ncbi:MAG TPA: protein kinase, partial [Pirellulales bacterium]
AALAELHQLEIVHGDLSALSLLLTVNGRITLSHPGLRGIVRPAEGYAYTDLPPEAYDTIAPERIALAAKPSIATDVYACGCLWWHLATGRAPFAGGNTIAKLRAVHSAKTVDVERLAPDVPAALAKAIRASMTPDPADRAASMRELSEILGPVGRGAASSVGQLLQQSRGPGQLWGPPIRRRKSLLARFGNASAAAACLGLLLGASVGWRYRHQVAWWPRWGAVEAKLDRHDANVDRTRDLAKQRPVRAPEGGLSGDVVSVATPPADTDAGGVVPVSHTQPVAKKEPAPVEPRLLPCERPQRIARLDLRPGQTVRGVEGGRPLVYVPAQGLLVQGENVSFENIDFVWDAPAMTPEDGHQVPAILRLSAERAEFRGCSFQDVRSQSDRSASDWRPVAIDWSCDLRSSDPRGASLGGEMACDNCVFSGVDAAIECRPDRVPMIEIRQSLHLRSGPLVRLDALPSSDQAFMLSLFNTTVRASAAVLECRVDSVSRDRLNATGRISVSAVDSVLALDSTAALILFSGTEPPEALLSQLDWTGQGSLVTPTAVMSAWRGDRQGLPRAIAEDRVQVAGLVRCQVEFAGDEDAGPAAAHIRRWQAPLRSNQPPGAGPGRLMLPKVGLMGR